MAAKREFFTTTEVAQTLGISPFTIRRYIQLRKLKAIKLEGSYRIRRTDLERFLQAREIETEEELAALDTEEPAAVPKKDRSSPPERPETSPEKRVAKAAPREPKPVRPSAQPKPRPRAVTTPK
jgi:excisionase family DNA binding protein